MTDTALTARCSGTQGGVTCWVRRDCERYEARGDSERPMATHKPDRRGKGCWYWRARRRPLEDVG